MVRNYPLGIQTSAATGVGMLYRIIVIVAFSLLFLTACSEKKNEDQKDETAVMEELIQRGQAYYEQGQYRASLIEAKNAIQRDPDNISGYVLLAQVFNALEQGKLASRELERFQGEKTWQFQLQLAQAYIYQNKFRSALNILQSIDGGKVQADQVNYLKISADAYFGLGELEKAEQYYNRAIAAAESNEELQPGPTVGLARVYLAQKDKPKALEKLQSVVNQQHSDAYLIRGVLAFQEGRFDDAEDLLSQALIVLPDTDVIIPTRVRILEGLVKILTQQGRSAEALVYSKILADANPAAQEMKSKFEEAMEVYKSGDMAKAEELLSDLYTKSGKNDMSGRMLGLVNYAQGNFEEANTFFGEHLDPETVSNEVIKIWAGSELRLNRPEKAAEIIKEKLSVTPDDADLNSLYGLVLLAQDNHEAAVEHIEKAISKDPQKVKLRLALAQYANRQGRPDDALKELEIVYQKINENVDVQTRYLRQLVAMEQQDKAWRDAKSLVKKYPDSAATYALAGAMALRMEENKLSKKYLMKALELQKDLTGAKYTLAQWYIVNKDFDSALSTYKEIIESKPEEIFAYRGIIAAAAQQQNLDSVVQYIETKGEQEQSVAAPLAVLADFKLNQKEIDSAVELAERALQRSPSIAYVQNVVISAYYQKALAGATEKNFQQAREYILKAIKVQPNNIRLLATLTEVEIGAGEHREAAKVIAQIEELFPESAATDILKGDLGVAKQKLEDAEQAYLDGWNKQPSDLIGRKLYDLYLGKNQTETAINHLNQWREKLPNSGAPVILLALEQQKAGDYKTAVELYEQFIEIAPNSVIAYNNLAWLYSELGDDRALETAEKAYTLAPTNGAVADTYGWLLVSKGQLRKGVDILEKAVEYAPDNVEIKEHLEQAKAKL